MTDYNTILVEQRGAVTLVTLNRPQALNALNSEVLSELTGVFAAYDADDGQHCLVLTGSEKAFAAGADIKEMSSQGFADMYRSDFFAGWEKVTATRKPWIAAVAGYALGGGCEVAMMADFIIAADSARFGAIPPPMWPRPMNAIFISSFLFSKRQLERSDQANNTQDRQQYQLHPRIRTPKSPIKRGCVRDDPLREIPSALPKFFELFCREPESKARQK